MRLVALLCITLALSARAEDPSALERGAFKWLVDPAIDVSARANVRFVRPVSIVAAKGRVKEVYQWCQRDFAPPAEPFLIQSPSPDALLGFWLISYEAFVPDRLPRVLKDSIAVAVSTTNRAPYCEQAHRAVALSTQPSADVKAALESRPFTARSTLPAAIDRYVKWAAGGGGYRSLGITPEEMPETAGVALVFHYVNRLVNTFTRRPTFHVVGSPSWKDRWFRKMAEWRTGKLARSTRPPGEAIRWALGHGYAPAPFSPGVLGTGRIGEAFGLWAGVMSRVHARLLSSGRVYARELDLLERHIRAGTRPEHLPVDESTPVTRFGLAVAFESDRIGDALERDLRSSRRASDALLVDLASWSAYLATTELLASFR